MPNLHLGGWVLRRSSLHFRCRVVFREAAHRRALELPRGSGHPSFAFLFFAGTFFLLFLLLGVLPEPASASSRKTTTAVELGGRAHNCPVIQGQDKIARNAKVCSGPRPGSFRQLFVSRIQSEQ